MQHELPDLFDTSLDDEQEEVRRDALEVPVVPLPLQRGDAGERAPEAGCLGCGSVVDRAAVTLASGHVVCNECPEYRHECEVRHIAAMPTRDDRQRYIAGVQRERGKPAAQRIIRDLWKLHDEATA